MMRWNPVGVLVFALLAALYTVGLFVWAVLYGLGCAVAALCGFGPYARRAAANPLSVPTQRRPS
jgi:hypothetical protein